MKIAVRGGHNFSVPGARAILDETREDRIVKDAVIKYLRKAGHLVIDVTAPDSCATVGQDLSYGVNKANDWNADLFISCHFNKAYDKFDGAIGTEVLVYSTKKDTSLAKKVLDNICKLGFKNRGIKERQELYELRRSNMNSMIIELCFVEATEDVKLYRSLGADRIARAIAEGISNRVILNDESQISKPNNKPVVNPQENSLNTAISKDSWVGDLQKELNKNYNSNLDVDSIAGIKTLNACPILRYGNSGELIKLVQKRLINTGFSCGKYGADSTFGESTKIAVKNFQAKNNLVVDGIIGRDTWKVFLKV